MNLGAVIKNARKKRGMTQGSFAKECDITQAYLSQIENNAKEPNMATLKRISLNLHVPLPILFFLALDENDVMTEKKDAFKMILPSVKSLVTQFFNENKE